MGHKKTSSHRGFTLIEVLIALAIIAISFTAVLQAINANTRNISYIKDKTTASFVAQEIIAKVQLDIIKIPKSADKLGTSRMLDRTWYWHVSVEPTSNIQLDEIVVKVGPTEEGSALITLDAYRRSKPDE